MSRLAPADQSALLHGLHEVNAQTEIDRRRGTLVRVAHRIIPSETGSDEEFLRAEARPTVALRFPERCEVVRHSPAFRAYFGAHPVSRHNRDTGKIRARKFSDFLTARQLTRLRLHHECCRRTGGRHQIVLSIDKDGETQRAISCFDGRPTGPGCPID